MKNNLLHNPTISKLTRHAATIFRAWNRTYASESKNLENRKMVLNLTMSSPTHSCRVDN